MKLRRHSGTGSLVYADATDKVGEVWCADCQQYLTPDKWREPCLSTRERRKGERRYPDAPPPAPAEGKRWIPVKECLPKVIEDVDGGVNCVLVYQKDGFECGSDIQVSNTVWLNKQHPMGSAGITHWMPLPEPPVVEVTAEGNRT